MATTMPTEWKAQNNKFIQYSHVKIDLFYHLATVDKKDATRKAKHLGFVDNMNVANNFVCC